MTRNQRLPSVTDMERLARFVIVHRRLVIAAWVLLAVVGAIGAGRLSNRWVENFSAPGRSAYDANQRALRTLGTGEQAPYIAVFHGRGDVTNRLVLGAAIASAQHAAGPGTRSSSFFTTGDHAYVSADRHTTFAEIYPAGQQDFNPKPRVDATREALLEATPPGVTANLTGRDPLYVAPGDFEGTGLFLEVLIAGSGALLVLLFIFGTLPAVAMPLVVAACSILTTFGLLWPLTYATGVLIIVEYLVALVGLGVAIDYSLLMIFRFREELAKGRNVEAALVQTMLRAGRSVIISGSTVAVGLLSLLVLPVPSLRSVGLAALLIPAVSVLAAVTLLPALLSLLGERINSVPVMPRRLRGREAREGDMWSRWARVVTRKPIVAAAVGVTTVGLLLLPVARINIGEAQAKDMPGRGDAIAGRAALTRAGISPGVHRPLAVLVEGEATPATVEAVVKRLNATPGVAAAVAPHSTGWRTDRAALVEAFATVDGASKDARATISTLQRNVLPAAEGAAPAGTRITLGGVAAEDRDFVQALYGRLPLMLAVVVLLSYVLLARAFRSLLLPLKAVLLNLASLGAAFGIVVFVFQQGHGSEVLWGVHATQATISWIPLMIFTFLFGLSMDYEVFILSRIREAYDDTGDTTAAVTLGLARTGKLVTSAALVLMFAFFAMSTGPAVDLKQFAIGVSAGIILDATVIRALLAPALICLFGRWNWWLPQRAARALLVTEPAPRAGGLSRSLGPCGGKPPRRRRVGDTRSSARSLASERRSREARSTTRSRQGRRREPRSGRGRNRRAGLRPAGRFPGADERPRHRRLVRPTGRLRAGTRPRPPSGAVRRRDGNAPLPARAETGNTRPGGCGHRHHRHASWFSERGARGCALPHRADSAAPRRGGLAHVVRPAEGCAFARHEARSAAPAAPVRRPARRLPRRDPPAVCPVPGATRGGPGTCPTRQVARIRLDLPGVHLSSERRPDRCRLVA
jgi:RND superfamily putative drug exporter